MHWDLNPSNVQTSSSGVVVSISERGEVIVSDPFNMQSTMVDLEGLPALVPRYVQRTSAQVEDPYTSGVRYACHVILDRLPAQGLPELCESLRSMWEFYSDRPSSSVALLPTPSKKIPAKRGKTYERPEFPIIPE